MRLAIAIVSALTFSTALGGCVMPPAVSVASALLDGISYVATDKSASDHVLSEVAQQDCAVWRVVKDELVCRDYTKGEQGLIATVADALEEGSTDGRAAVAVTVQPVGQISALE